MTGAWPIYKRELKEYLQSASTYVALGLFFLMAGVVFHDLLALFSSDCELIKADPLGGKTPNITISVIEGSFQMLTAILLFIVPILSMRLIAGERTSGQLELLSACPVSDWGLVAGKYFALVTVGLGVIALCGAYPGAVYAVGSAQGAVPELSVVFACFLGLMLVFAAYAAFGVMASAFAANQVSASIFALIGLILWNLMGDLPSAGEEIRTLAGHASAMRHSESFTRGLLSLKDAAFYVLCSWIFLFAAVRALEARRENA